MRDRIKRPKVGDEWERLDEDPNKVLEVDLLTAFADNLAKE